VTLLRVGGGVALLRGLCRCRRGSVLRPHARGTDGVGLAGCSATDLSGGRRPIVSGRRRLGRLGRRRLSLTTF